MLKKSKTESELETKEKPLERRLKNTYKKNQRKMWLNKLMIVSITKNGNLVFHLLLEEQIC